MAADRIDVLAVLDAFAGHAILSSAHPPMRISEVRAAVVELVEELRAIQTAARLGRRYWQTGPGYVEEIEQRAIAALARMEPQS